ncbi:MAG: hypothetical protein ACK4RV_17210 [Caulobacter sp.]
MNDKLSLGAALAAASALVRVEARPDRARLALKVFEVTFDTSPREDIGAFIGAGITQVGDLAFLAVDPADKHGWFETLAEDLVAYRLFPVMSDGCGNLHAVYIDDPVGGPVYFFEAIEGYSRSAQVSASSIPRLVVAAANASVDDEFWSSPAKVLAVDPFLRAERGACLPWQAD